MLFFQILRFFLCIPASAADASSVDPNGIKTLLVKCFNYIFINGNPVSNNGLTNLTRSCSTIFIFER